jgi:Holliday junction resolvasome RuvABC endonuclease subunit
MTERARLDADRKATGKTILTAPVRGDSRDGTYFPGPASTHVDLETGVRTPLAAPQIIIAFDPGSKKTGLAVLEGPIDRQARPKFQWGGHVPNDGAMRELRLLATIRAAYPIVAVESPSGFIHQHARGAQLLETAKVAGELVGLAKSLGLRVVEMPRQDWARALCGKGIRGSPGDRHVKRAVEMFVSNLPKRSSTHVRDAIGLAVVTIWNQGARR